MAKRKRRSKNRHTGRNLIISILAVIVIFLGVYVGHHFYRIWNQQRIEQEAREKDRRAKQLFIQQVAPEAQAMQPIMSMHQLRLPKRFLNLNGERVS